MRPAVGIAGRRHELRSLLQDVDDDDCSAVVITGEAGIGKSRLATALIETVRADGACVLAGGCLRLSRALSFLPVGDVLRDLDDIDNGAFLRSLLTACPAYVRVELARLRPELDPEGRAPRSDPTQYQRLMESLRLVLAGASAQRRTVIVLEDVQWADTSTLAFCDYLLAPRHRTGATLVLTCRPDETDPDWFVETTTSAQVRLLHLGPLSRAETSEQMALLRGGDVDADEADAVYLRTRGHAFFTEQLVTASPLLGGTDIPAGLRPVLLSRFAQQQGPSRRLLGLLAVAARPLTEETLTSALGWEAEEARELLHQLVRARLVTHDQQHYALRHALIGDAIRSELLPGELRVFHAAAAKGLASTAADQIPGEIALHWAAAGDTEQQLSWEVRAAETADRLNSASEAAAHWDRVIDLCRRNPHRLPPGRTRTELYLRSSWAFEHLGRPQEAAERAELALTALSPNASTAERAKALRVVGHWRSLRRPEDGSGLLRASIELCRQLPPSRDQGLTAHRLVQLLFQQRGRVDDEQIALIDEAVRVSSSAEARGVQRMLIGAHAFASLMRGDRDGAVQAAERATSAPRDPTDPHGTIGAGIYIADVLSACGGVERAVSLGYAELDWIDENGYPTAPTATALRARVALGLYQLGRLDEAVSLGGQRDHPIPTLVGEYLGQASGEVEPSTMRSGAGDGDPLEPKEVLDPVLAALRMEPRLWIGSAAGIESAADEALASLAAAGQTVRSRFAGGLLALSMRGCADLAGLGRRRDQPDRIRAAMDLAQRFERAAIDCTVDPFGGDLPARARVDALNWSAERARLIDADIPELWDSAATEWISLAFPFQASYARLRQAEALLASPTGRASAAPVLRQAAELAAGHRPLRIMIDDLARRARIATGALPTLGSVPMSAEPQTTPFGLTARELTVLREIGEGRTNAQIAHSLFISRSTAGVHVSNVLRKLHVGSRVQAAAIASSLGLLTAPDGHR